MKTEISTDYNALPVEDMQEEFKKTGKRYIITAGQVVGTEETE